MTDAPLELIQARISTPGWTPGKRDIEPLFAVWRHLSDDERESMEKRLARLDGPSAGRAAEMFAGLDERSRGELARPLVKSFLRSQRHEVQIEFPLKCLKDSVARVRKGALQAIGSSWGDLAGAVKNQLIEILIQSLGSVSDVSEKKALIEALGKCGDERAFAALKNSGVQSGKSLLTLERDVRRGDHAEGRCELGLFQAEGIVLWFTHGIEQLARRMTPLLGAEVLEHGVLKLEHNVSWVQIKDIKLWREMGFVIGRDREQTPLSLARELANSAARLRQATAVSKNIPVRVRLGRRDHRPRSFIWDFAEALSKLTSDVMNDGRQAHWELRTIGEWLVLVPLAFEDERFGWRDPLVEGASDPTIAQALVQVADLRPNEVIFDPFCGAATELVLAKQECPGVIALGTDISAEVIKSAQLAIERANVDVKVVHADALTYQPSRPIDVVITNPPFGMRTLRGEARGVLQEFLQGVARRLSQNGRVIMVSPAPVSSVEWATAGGLRLKTSIPVYLGGMRCELQYFVRGRIYS